MQLKNNTIRDILDTNEEMKEEREEKKKEKKPYADEKKTPCCAHIYTSLANFLTSKETETRGSKVPPFALPAPFPRPMPSAMPNQRKFKTHTSSLFATLAPFCSPPCSVDLHTHAGTPVPYFPLPTLFLSTEYVAHMWSPNVRFYHVLR